jgi:biotin transport system ATP-binding protein
MIELREASVVVPTPEGDRAILRPTSLELRERRVALIGPTGSGKSTIARLLNGLIEPSSGAVLVSAVSGADRAAPPAPLDTRRDGAAVRRLVGFVFTNPAAQLVMPTVLEDVALSLRRTHRDKPARLAAARAALDRFGLGELAERSVHALSGGQQQLLALASVLATEPAVLVADEPTTLLDLRNARLVADTLLGLPQQLVVATHDLELAARCDRVLVIEGGGVALDTAARGCAPVEAIDWYRSRV